MSSNTKRFATEFQAKSYATQMARCGWRAEHRYDDKSAKAGRHVVTLLWSQDQPNAARSAPVPAVKK